MDPTTAAPREADRPERPAGNRLPGRAGVLLAGSIAIAAVLAALLLTHNWGFGPTPSGAPRRGGVLEDSHDRTVYQRVGRWVASGGTPYLEDYSIYPQITTWFLGLPYVWIEHSVTPGEPFGYAAAAREALVSAGLTEAEAADFVEVRNRGNTGPAQNEAAWAGGLIRRGIDVAAVRGPLQRSWRAEREHQAEIERDSKAYGDAYHVLMAGLLLLHLVLATGLLRRTGHSAAWALLSFLPASLFFAFNRLDLLVVCSVEGALLALLARRRALAGSLLGVAIMVKWFPLVLAPAFVSFGLQRAREKARREGREFQWISALRQEAVLPLAAAGVVCLACLAVTFVQGGGGMDAVLWLPRWHSDTRAINAPALLAILTSPEQLGWVPKRSQDTLLRVFPLLQLTPGLLLAFLPIRDWRRLVQVCLLATLCCILFSRFYSPQWVLWTAMFTVLLAPERRRYLWIPLLLDLVTYVQLPIIVHGSEQLGPPIYWDVNLARAVVLVVLFLLVLFDLARDVLTGNPPRRARELSAATS